MAAPTCRVLVGMAGILAWGAVGCASAPLYSWGGYERSLYSRYVREDLPQSAILLHDTIVAAERTGARVPPGAYADYGFLLYRRSDYAGAVRYFEKEAAAFPESAALMAKIVERVRQQQQKATAEGGGDTERAGRGKP